MKPRHISSSVVCLGPPKEAALYFDRVFPVDLGIPAFLAHGTEVEPASMEALLQLYVPPIGNSQQIDVLRSLLDGASMGFEEYVKHIGVSFAFVLVAAEASTKGKFPSLLDSPGWSEAIREVTSLSEVDIFAEMRRARMAGTVSAAQISRFNASINGLVRRAGFGKSPVWEDPNFLSLFSKSVIPEAKEQTFLASLSQLKLVDLENVSWNQIIQFRKDDRARATLRDLRLFFTENYAGKEQSYVAESLQSRIEAYDREARAWGFQTALKALEVAFSKESVLSSSIAGLSTALSGAPLPAAVGISAATTVGTCVLQVGKAIVDRKVAGLSRSTRYLTQLRDEFSGKGR